MSREKPCAESLWFGVPAEITDNSTVFWYDTLSFYYFLLARFTHRFWRRKPLKRRWTPTRLHAVTSEYCLAVPTMEKDNGIGKPPSLESASELYQPSDRRFSVKLVPTFTDRGCDVVSVMDTYGRILAFLDRSRYFFFQVAPQLYSRGWVDPVSDPLLLRKSGSAGNGTRTSGSVARNSDH
jgi:hypothetical protein